MRKKHTFKIKPCIQCGSDFQPLNSNSKYCSHQCNVDHSIKKENGPLDTQCYIWQKRLHAKNKNGGYGIMSTSGKREVLVHRFVCESVYGIAPIDKPFACHSCGNPKCCNPEHLYWGSPSDNIQDALSMGTHVSHPGIKNGNSKTTEKQVYKIIELYKNGKTINQICEEMNITYNRIWSIVKNKSWKHIPR